MKLKPDFITQNIEDTQFLIAIGGAVYVIRRKRQ